MSKEMEYKMVPRLRFPEFRDEGEWKESQLGKYLLQHPDYGINAAAVPYSSNLPTYLRITDISGDGNFLRNQMVSVKEKVIESNYLEEGDIVFARTGASVGKSYKYRLEDGRLVFAGFLIRVKPKKEKLSPEFLFQFLSTNQYWHWVNLTSARSGQPGINGNEYSSMPIPVPTSISEQQKIANCLSSLDDLIAAQNEKLYALKVHKKGLMQQLFPAEGETVPRLRFAEFRDAGEWEEKDFSSYIKLYRGSSPRPIQEYLTQSESGVNWIKIGDTKFSKNYIIYKIEEKITPEGAEKSRKVEVGELILANSMSFGKTYQLAIEGYIYDGWFVLREYEKHFYKPFLLQLLNSEYMQKQYQKLSAGGIVQNISSEIVYNTMLFHTSVEEQQRIADTLSSLDELIAAQTQKLEALKTHKKGLMQQLFPNPNEIEE